MSYLKVLSDGSSWPGIYEASQLNWRLRYSPDSITREDQLVLASILGSYSYMMYDTNRATRDLVSKDLSKEYEDGIKSRKYE